VNPPLSKLWWKTILQSHQDWNYSCLILESSSAELMKDEGVLEIRSEEQLTKNQKHKLRKKLSRRHKVVISILSSHPLFCCSGTSDTLEFHA